jgi:hypothetical protein
MALFVFMAIKYKRMASIILDARQEAEEMVVGARVARFMWDRWMGYKDRGVARGAVKKIKYLMVFTRHRLLQIALLNAMRRLRGRIATAQIHWRWLRKRRAARLQVLTLFVLRWERQQRRDASEVGSISGIRFPAVSLVEIRKRQEMKQIRINKALMEGKEWIDPNPLLPSACCVQQNVASRSMRAAFMQLCCDAACVLSPRVFVLPVCIPYLPYRIHHSCRSIFQPTPCVQPGV